MQWHNKACRPTYRPEWYFCVDYCAWFTFWRALSDHNNPMPTTCPCYTLLARYGLHRVGSPEWYLTDSLLLLLSQVCLRSGASPITTVVLSHTLISHSRYILGVEPSTTASTSSFHVLWSRCWPYLRLFFHRAKVKRSVLVCRPYSDSIQFNSIQYRVVNWNNEVDKTATPSIKDLISWTKQWC